ncbi:MAG: serine-type D-Ala-D-Ala carboxypeptidase [bacterium]|nr:MAG: serine-type D-Ala-D-Ala carboxypeptidase [bacterium]
MRLLTAVLVLLFMVPSASTAMEPSSYGIDRILEDPCLKKADYCVLAKSLDGEILYAKNAGELMTPASNMKVITSAAALEILKPSFKFKTVFSYTGKRKGDVIEGDLVIAGHGNPHLVSEDMWVMANELRKSGIRRITGNMLLDDSYFDGQRYSRSWKLSNNRRAFEAPTGALSLNFNSVTINIYPSAKPGVKPGAALDPQSSYLELVNNLSSSRRRSSIKIFFKPRGGGGETVTLAGNVMANSKNKTYYRSVSDPVLYFGLTFREFLGSAGINLDGKIVHVPNGSAEIAKEIFIHSSWPLTDQVRYMNKFSSNFMAEQILKTIGAEAVSIPGSFEKGIKKIEEFLRSLGFRQDGFRIVDGSGLSAENRISCVSMVDLLDRFYKRWDSGPEFVSSLALMGMDGSVEDRLVNNGKTIRVKTGSLNFVSALSGYYPLASGGIAAFSIIMNNFSCSNGHVLAIQDRLINEFGKY